MHRLNLNAPAIFILAALLSGCTAYRYTGVGDYDQFTRTYVPVIGVTKGFMIALPSFRSTADVSTTFRVGRLPRYNDTLYVDLVSAAFDQPPTVEADKLAGETLPPEHAIVCTLTDKKSGEVISRVQSKVRDLPQMQNPMLRRHCVFNLMKVEVSKIPRRENLEVHIEYSVHGKPVDREMTIGLSMIPPTA